MEYFVNLCGEVGVEMYTKVWNSYIRGRKNDAEMFTFFLNTDGGDQYQGLAIYDLIKEISKEIKTKVIVYGQCNSSGMFILQAADLRVASPNAFFMIHYGETSVEGLNELKHTKELTDLHTKICTERFKVRRKTIESWYEGNKYFNAKEALRLGVIDVIS